MFFLIWNTDTYLWCLPTLSPQRLHCPLELLQLWYRLHKSVPTNLKENFTQTWCDLLVLNLRQITMCTKLMFIIEHWDRRVADTEWCDCCWIKDQDHPNPVTCMLCQLIGTLFKSLASFLTEYVITHTLTHMGIKYSLHKLIHTFVWYWFCVTMGKVSRSNIHWLFVWNLISYEPVIGLVISFGCVTALGTNSFITETKPSANI